MVKRKNNDEQNTKQETNSFTNVGCKFIICRIWILFSAKSKYNKEKKTNKQANTKQNK